MDDIDAITFRDDIITFRMLVFDRKFKFDGKGHSAFRLAHDLEECLGALSLFTGLAPEDRERLSKAWETDTPLAEPVALNDYYAGVCSFCRKNGYVTDGFTISADKPCEHPNGLLAVVELDIPSGRMIVGNDFREKFNIEADHYVNEAHGIYDTIVDFAKEAKMFHFFVSNSSPGMYRSDTDPDSFVIANAKYNEEEGDDVDEWLPIEGFKEEVASVCTDLWWVSIVDGDEADKRGLDQERFDTTEVRCTPGTYVLEASYGMTPTRPAWDEETIYAKIRKS
jgi:hypothetical protein